MPQVHPDHDPVLGGPRGGGSGRAAGVRAGGGAVAAAHPAAADAGARVLADGGTAVDAAIAAQAVVCVAMPHAAGPGGDVVFLVRAPDGSVTGVSGTGRSPARLPAAGPRSDGGASVTVPGLVAGWVDAHARWGRRPLAELLAPAVAHARDGIPVGNGLRAAVAAQRGRLARGGARDWALLAEPPVWRQPELARLLERVGVDGTAGFYRGAAARAVVEAVRRTGGTLDEDDLADHRSVIGAPVTVGWGGGRAHVQPPPTQGVLLAMALAHLDVREAVPDDHVLVELTEAVFEHRSDCALGAALLRRPLTVGDRHRTRERTPRAYLHTAGVAVADAAGGAVSSLVSVFDDFGSAVFVPELGLVLNNRAAGFTDGANAPAAATRPVHTLAPMLLEGGDGSVLALATPGADGQVQTLLQVLVALRDGPGALVDVVDRPRWRSEAGRLLVEAGHPGAAALRRSGHDVVERPFGADLFGAVVAAGTDRGGPFAVADPRRGVAVAPHGLRPPTEEPA